MSAQGRLASKRGNREDDASVMVKVIVLTLRRRGSRLKHARSQSCTFAVFVDIDFRSVLMIRICPIRDPHWVSSPPRTLAP